LKNRPQESISCKFIFERNFGLQDFNWKCNHKDP
jgi:hypothetical protein